MSTLLILLGMFIGAVMPVCIPMIAQTARLLGSGPMAKVPFFFIAYVAAVVVANATGNRATEIGKIASLPLLPLTAGIMSAGIFIGTSFPIPRIRIVAFFVLAVSGEVIAGMIFGPLGLSGAPQTAIRLGKVAGAG